MAKKQEKTSQPEEKTKKLKKLQQLDGTRPHVTEEDVMAEYHELKAAEDAKPAEPDSVVSADNQPSEPDGLIIPGPGDLAVYDFKNNVTREPTQEELEKMGAVMLQSLLGNPSIQSAPLPVMDTGENPPPPKISGNHCRLCQKFWPNDPRGPLWATGGYCGLKANHQPPVEPEDYCNSFQFNEGLRG